MIWWVLWLAVVTVLSYLADAGVVTVLQEIRVPYLNGSVISVLLLMSTLGLLFRVQGRKKTGEKEMLNARISELEQQLASKKANTRA
jgi:hypothetical protein